MPQKTNILVVADKAADSPELIAALRRRSEAGTASFTLLVPAVSDGLSGAAGPQAAWSLAAVRAEAASIRIRRAGLDLAEAIVGDPDPEVAIGDVLHARIVDEVIVLGERREELALAA